MLLCVLALAQKVFWPAFTFISGFGQFAAAGSRGHSERCVCVCVPTWLWVAAATRLVASTLSPFSTGIVGARWQVKRFMRLLVIIYGLHICVFLASICFAIVVVFVVAFAISWRNEVF